MADNVLVDNGAEADFIVSTEEITTLNGAGVSAQQLQRVAMALRTADGTAVDLPGDSTNGLKVQVAAGTNNIGDVDVLSVVPGTGATSLGKAEDSGHTSADTGVMALAVRRDAGTTLVDTDLDYAPLQVDAAGALRVSGAGGGTQYTEADVDTTITGTAVMWEDASDTLRAASAAKPLPVNPVASAVSTDSVAAAMVATATVPTGFTALSPIRVISAASNNATSIKGSAGQIYWLHVTSIKTTSAYLKLYNKATAPVPASDSSLLVHTFLIPFDANGRGFVLPLPVPITFSTGIGLAIVAGIGDSDNTSIDANTVIVNGGYR